MLPAMNDPEDLGDNQLARAYRRLLPAVTPGRRIITELCCLNLVRPRISPVFSALGREEDMTLGREAVVLTLTPTRRLSNHRV